MNEQTKEETKAFLGVNIPESLFIELKKKAAEQRRTLTDIVIEVLQKYLKF